METRDFLAPQAHEVSQEPLVGQEYLVSLVDQGQMVNLAALDLSGHEAVVAVKDHVEHLGWMDSQDLQDHEDLLDLVDRLVFLVVMVGVGSMDHLVPLEPLVSLGLPASLAEKVSLVDLALLEREVSLELQVYLEALVVLVLMEALAVQEPRDHVDQLDQDCEDPQDVLEHLDHPDHLETTSVGTTTVDVSISVRTDTMHTTVHAGRVMSLPPTYKHVPLLASSVARREMLNNLKIMHFSNIWTDKRDNLSWVVGYTASRLLMAKSASAWTRVASFQ